ncbi:hypothetical protein VTL71DRAFT_9805 [Oculimacula yallundae]|uniref:Uncharacterized protein n=1 Tax=Oculimacula yallundae TaxID=86028 RepID=A0ABR4BQH7_9HELO
MHFSNGIIIALAALSSAAPIVEIVERNGRLVEALVEPANLTERQETLGSDCLNRGHKATKWVKADDPNPHQNFVFKQITGSQQCRGSPGNSAAIASGLTVGWAFSIGGSFSANPEAGGPGASLDIGYSISRSVSTTRTYGFGCASDTGSHQEPVCGFQRVQVTAYTVKEQSCDAPRPGCFGSKSNCKDTGKTGVVFAPNKDQGGADDGNPGNCYYDNFQLGLPCITVGNEIRSNPSSIPGGPQFVSCTDARSAPGQ